MSVLVTGAVYRDAACSTTDTEETGQRNVGLVRVLEESAGLSVNPGGASTRQHSSVCDPVAFHAARSATPRPSAPNSTTTGAQQVSASSQEEAGKEGVGRQSGPRRRATETGWCW